MRKFRVSISLSTEVQAESQVDAITDAMYSIRYYLKEIEGLKVAVLREVYPTDGGLGMLEEKAFQDSQNQQSPPSPTPDSF